MNGRLRYVALSCFVLQRPADMRACTCLSGTRDCCGYSMSLSVSLYCVLSIHVHVCDICMYACVCMVCAYACSWYDMMHCIVCMCFACYEHIHVTTYGRSFHLRITLHWHIHKWIYRDDDQWYYVTCENTYINTGTTHTNTGLTHTDTGTGTGIDSDTGCTAEQQICDMTYIPIEQRQMHEHIYAWLLAEMQICHTCTPWWSLLSSYQHVLLCIDAAHVNTSRCRCILVFVLSILSMMLYIL